MIAKRKQLNFLIPYTFMNEKELFLCKSDWLETHLRSSFIIPALVMAVPGDVCFNFETINADIPLKNAAQKLLPLTVLYFSGLLDSVQKSFNPPKKSNRWG